MLIYSYENIHVIDLSVQRWIHINRHRNNGESVSEFTKLAMNQTTVDVNTVRIVRVIAFNLSCWFCCIHCKNWWHRSHIPVLDEHISTYITYISLHPVLWLPDIKPLFVIETIYSDGWSPNHCPRRRPPSTIPPRMTATIEWYKGKFAWPLLCRLFKIVWGVFIVRWKYIVLYHAFEFICGINIAVIHSFNS